MSGRQALAPGSDHQLRPDGRGVWLGIIRWFASRVTNGLLEGLNSLVQAAKRCARGYRSTRNYIAMTYLTVGKLDLHVTHAK
ncbi:MAG: transposase [Vicinamibacterales bacterium]